MTEMVSSDQHTFLVEVGSPAGAAVLADVRLDRADDAVVAGARAAVADAAGKMGRSMPAGILHELMAASNDAARWDYVASRCVSCGNCTMACPTCFCTARR